MPANWKGVFNRVQRTALTAGVFLAGITLSGLAWMVAESRVEEYAAAKADAAIADASEAIQERLRSSYDVVYAMQGLFRAADQHVTHEEFHHFVAGLKLNERHPAIRAVSYGERVMAAELPGLLARV